jgi:hypothetical protein
MRYLSSPNALQAAGKSLNFRPADVVLPPLCLDVNYVQTEPVFLDDSVDTAIAGLTYSLPSVFQRAVQAVGQPDVRVVAGHLRGGGFGEEAVAQDCQRTRFEDVRTR